MKPNEVAATDFKTAYDERRWRTTPDARPRHADVWSPPLLVLRCGEWRHTISGPIHSWSFVTQVQLGWIMDMWRFCSPIGSDCCWQINGRLGLRIVANYGGIINLHEQIQPTFALKKSSNVRANKTPPFASCRKSCRTEYGPPNAQQYVHDGQWPDWELYPYLQNAPIG
jgi:hypothetical protein